MVEMLANWVAEGCVGREVLISAVSSSTVLPTPFMMPSLVVCYRIMAFTMARDTLQKDWAIKTPLTKLIL